MKKPFLALTTLLLIILLAIAIVLPVSAEDVIHSGTWGNLTWTLNKTTGELIISGEGEMENFSSSKTDAWRELKNFIYSVTIEDGVTNICDSAFYNCYNMTGITIPNSVTSIGNYAFSGCYVLKNFTIPSSVISIGQEAFSDCYFSKITIPTGVKSIGSRAFARSYLLKDITIPNSVTSIGHDAFIGCTSLNSIIVEQGNPAYHSVENWLIETNSKTLLWGYKNSNIPNDGSVTSIGDYAFYGNHDLTSIVIPNGIISIGEYTFSDCRSLTNITIPSSITSIGAKAFSYCDNLETVIYCGTDQNIITLFSNITIQQHNYEWKAIDGETHQKICSSCKNILISTENHVYSDDSDMECNECGITRAVSTEPSTEPSTNTPNSGDENSNSSNSEASKSGCGASLSGGFVTIVSLFGLGCVMVRKRKI